ncbi:MAG: YggS family pyridoxal phosphate-dependent enzyme [Bacteroidales bacterium]|nr:YggS family pyridoxal phosphate-dependent enzyme [Bacteroidales bacterium]
MISKESLIRLQQDLPPNVKLVAVSKFKPIEDILQAYNLGVKDFAENRPQELSQKMGVLPDDIRWHFVGHLQTNKIKFIIERVNLIHSVDSLKLLREIDKEAFKKGVVVNILLQVYISSEVTKQGLSQIELNEIAEQNELFKNINICGVMGMASFTDDVEIIKEEFSNLRRVFDNLKLIYFSNNDQFCELSMGMSSDYKIAIQQGSTIVRIGSMIFGDR